MSALGQKQTCAVQEAMSALPRKRTCAVHSPMSALGQKRTSVGVIYASSRRPESKGCRLRHHRLSFGSTNRQRLTAPTPPPGLGFKYAMATSTTVAAPRVCGQIPCCHVVPIAANQHCTAGITISSLTCGVVNIPCIDVMNACIHGYLACPLQRCVGGTFLIFQSGWKAVKCKGTSGPR